MNGTSPLDLVRSAEIMSGRPSIEALAYSEPDVTSIAPHVFEAHNRNKDLPPRHGKTKASITFNPAIGALEIIPQSREALDVLRRLGVGAEVEISW